MRTRIGTILIAVVALVVGVAAGWLAGRVSTPNVPDAKVSAPRASEQSTRTSGVGAHRPAANVVDKPRHAAVKVNADERREADTAKQEEKPAQVAQPELQKDDNPFPRYLDMFKNNPEALTAEFQKEAEADRASLAELRMRRSLIKKGMIFSPSIGMVAYTVPMFGAYMMRMSSVQGLRAVK